MAVVDASGKVVKGDSRFKTGDTAFRTTQVKTTGVIGGTGDSAAQRLVSGGTAVGETTVTRDGRTVTTSGGTIEQLREATTPQLTEGTAIQGVSLSQTRDAPSPTSQQAITRQLARGDFIFPEQQSPLGSTFEDIRKAAFTRKPLTSISNIAAKTPTTFRRGRPIQQKGLLGSLFQLGEALGRKPKQTTRKIAETLEDVDVGLGKINIEAAKLQTLPTKFILGKTFGKEARKEFEKVEEGFLVATGARRPLQTSLDVTLTAAGAGALGKLGRATSSVVAKVGTRTGKIVQFGQALVRTPLVGAGVFSLTKRGIERTRTGEQIKVARTSQFKRATAAGRQAERETIEKLTGVKGFFRKVGFETTGLIGDRKAFETAFKKSFSDQLKETPKKPQFVSPLFTPSFQSTFSQTFTKPTKQTRALAAARISRTARGAGELASLFAQSASIELAGRGLLAKAPQKFGTGFRTIGTLGAIEGASQTLIGDVAKGRTPTTKRVLAGAGFGAATAGVIGGALQSAGLLTRPQKKFTEFGVYLSDVDEFVGDKLADIVQKASKGSKQSTKVFTPTIVPFTTAKPTAPTSQVTLKPSSPATSPFTFQQTSTITDVPSEIISQTPTDVGTPISTSTSTITQTPTQTFTQVPTQVPTQTQTQTPVGTSTFTPTFTPTKLPLVPFFPVGGGFSSRGRSFRKRTKALRRRTPTLFAAGFKVFGKRSKAGELTGLGIRPLLKSKKKKKKRGLGVSKLKLRIK